MAQHRHDFFGDLLVTYRTAARLTQEELAEQAELSVRGLRYLERGMRRPYRDTIERLAGALDLDPERQRALFAAARPVPTDNTSRGTVPLPPTPLIGRQSEVQSAIDPLQRDEVRLLTLTGPGGVGRTRLASRWHLHCICDC